MSTPNKKPPKPLEELSTYVCRRSDTGEWWGQNGRHGDYGRTMWFGEKPKSYNKLGILRQSLSFHKKILVNIPIEIVELGPVSTFKYEGPNVNNS